MSKPDNLLNQLETARTDLQSRADIADSEAQENRAKRNRAMAAFKAATVANDPEAQAEAQALIQQLDGDFEMLQAQVEALRAALDTGGEPLRSIALQIKEAAQARARERRDKWDEAQVELQALATQFLEQVAKMGQLNKQSAGGPAWEVAQNFLPRGLNVLGGGVLPSNNFQNQRGPIFLISPASIERSYREGKVVNHV